MIQILDELKQMIKMQGGDPSRIDDIAFAVVTLKKLMIENSKKPANPIRDERQSERREERRDYRPKRRNEE